MSEIWNLSSLCRCCHSDGTFKSLYLSYIVKGQKEQYAEMLKDTFDIVMDQAPPNASTMVCDDCIYELKKATRFKKQVLDCERKFAEYCLNEQTNQLDVKIECESEDNCDDRDNADEWPPCKIEVDIKMNPKQENANNDLSPSVAAPDTEEIKNDVESTVQLKKKGKQTKTEKDPKTTKSARLRAKEMKKNIESMVLKNDKQTENDKDPKATRGVNAKDTTKTPKPKPNEPLIVPVESDSSKSFTCKECGELFDNLTRIRAHIKAVHSKTRSHMHKCHFCDEEFPNHKLRSEHSITHFADNKFKCHVCGKSYSTLAGLETHLNEHTKRKIFICDYCNKEFVHKNSLRLHVLIHMGTRVRLMCDLCGVQCNDKTQLRMHTNSVHEKLRPFGCQKCDVWFATKRRLKYHEMRHTGDMPYKCEVCAKQFPAMEHLKGHLKTHRSCNKLLTYTQKIYTCPHCEAKFESKSKYLSHRRSFVHLHLNEKILAKNLKCEYCDRIFENKYAHNRHMNLHFGTKNFSCDVCDKKFTDKSSVLRHMRRHQASKDKQTCTLCPRKVRNMEKHMKAHTEKPYECQHCNRSYAENKTLNRHIRTKHLNIRPHVCPMCPARFVRPDALKRHNMRKHNGVEYKPPPPVEVDLGQIKTFKIEKV